MQNFVFRDSNFDLNNSQQYSLSIQADLNGFSFVIRRTDNGQIENIHSQTYTLSNPGVLARKTSELLDDNQLSGVNFGKVQLFLPGYFPALFAEEYAHEKEFRSYLLEKKSVKSKNRTVCHTPVLSGYQLGWLIDSIVKETFTDLFPEAEIGYWAVPAFRYFQELHVPDRFDWFCHLTDKEVFFTGFNNGQIAFFNSFVCPEDSDILYYFLAITKISGLNNVHFSVSGHKSRSETLLKQFTDLGFWGDHLQISPILPENIMIPSEIIQRIFPLLI